MLHYLCRVYCQRVYGHPVWGWGEEVPRYLSSKSKRVYIVVAGLSCGVKHVLSTVFTITNTTHENVDSHLICNWKLTNFSYLLFREQSIWWLLRDKISPEQLHSVKCLDLPSGGGWKRWDCMTRKCNKEMGFGGKRWNRNGTWWEAIVRATCIWTGDKKL